MQSTEVDPVQEQLAAAALQLSIYKADPSDITALAHSIADSMDDGDWGAIRDNIIGGLKSLSGQNYWQNDSPERCVMGYAAPLGAYWWHTGAETCWSADPPEWWDNQIAQWSA